MLRVVGGGAAGGRVAGRSGAGFAVARQLAEALAATGGEG
jgi:hypothetical protein